MKSSRHPECAVAELSSATLASNEAVALKSGAVGFAYRRVGDLGLP
ncbi:hypothetical protein PATSB16_00240 [Pandoraea thiooxydans]|nr:hypothetical protein PATSB16_00240 [Pandoraea thiooxydans]